MFLTSNPFKTMYTNGCFQLHISWCTLPNYIPKFWEEILFEAVLLKFEKIGSIHSRDEARTTNTPKNWDVSWTSSSAANHAREHDLHTNLALTWLPTCSSWDPSYASSCTQVGLLRLFSNHPFCRFFFSRRSRFATSQRNQYSTFY